MEPVGKLLCFVTKVAITIRMHSAYNPRAEKTIESGIALMHLSDLLHYFDYIGKSISNSDFKSAKRDADEIIKIWERNKTFIANASRIHMDNEPAFEIEEGINIMKEISGYCESKINSDFVQSQKPGELFDAIYTKLKGILAPVISSTFDSPFKEFTIMFARNLNFALSICEIKDDPFEIGSFFDKGYAYIVWRTIEAHIKKYPCGNASIKEALESIEDGVDENKGKADALCNLYKNNHKKYGSNQIDYLVGVYTHDKLHASAAIEVLLSAIKSFVAK